MAAPKYQMIGRYMNGTSVEAYAIKDINTGKEIKVSREQTVFLVGKALIVGISGRMYEDQVLLEAEAGHTKIADLPKYDVNKQRVKFKGNAMQGTNRKPLQFDSVTLVARVDNGGFVIQTGTGIRVIDRAALIQLLEQKKVINANIQKYDDGHKVQQIVRMSDKSRLSDLPVYKEEQVTGR